MSNLNPARAGLLETFALDLPLTRGDGVRLFDEAGREYLDFLSQYGALPFGQNPREIWQAVSAFEASGMPTMIQPLRAPEAERLAERLAELTPGDLSIVTLANSGAEAVEAAIKLARVRTGRDAILATQNGFHGKTLGALSATGRAQYQTDFAAPLSGFDHVPFGDVAALEARLADAPERFAAFIVEPIQGEGGVVRPPEDYLDRVIAACRRHGVLVVVDEIQTGLGRTGRLFACEDGAETPDMLLLAKALGGGLMPIAACIARPDAWDDRFGRLHSSTFANNNLACRVANATLDRLLADDRALIRHVDANGARLREGLDALAAEHPGVIREVRGRGYMAGLEFHPLDGRTDSATMAFASLNGGFAAIVSSFLMNVEGVLTAPLFNDSHVLRLSPPLVAEAADIDRALGALGRVCEIIARRDYVRLVRHLVAPSRAAKLAADPPAPSRGAPSRAAATRGGRRFAFLIHYTEEADIYRSDPSFAAFDDRELADWKQWVKRLGPGAARRLPEVASRTGDVADGLILSVPLLPQDMTGKGKALAGAMVRDAVGVAAQHGAGRLGLGAFTSIVTRGGATVTGEGLPITSGNTLTTVSAVQSIETVAARVGLPLERARVAVVGASGAIGRLAAMMLARRVGELTLVGNAGNPFAPKLLSKVADDVVASLARDGDDAAAGRPGALRAAVRRVDGGCGGAAKGRHERFVQTLAAAGEPAPLAFTTDLSAALARADVVLVATSADTTLVDPARLRPGTLVCDVARPPNVAQASLEGSGVLVFDGGLVKPPFDLDLGPFQTLPENLCWGCLGETMLLTLAGETRDFSIGATLSLDDADHVAGLAQAHGFEPAEARWYGERVGEPAFRALAEALRTGRDDAATPPLYHVAAE